MKGFKFKKSNLAKLKKNQIKLLYREGNTIEEIMEQVDMAYNQIKNYLVAENILKKPGKPDQKTRDRLITKLFKKGKTPRDIGIELHLPTQMVTYILRRLRLADKRKYYAGQVFTSSDALVIFKKKLGVKVRKDYSDGKSIEEIMSEHKITLRSVKNFLVR